MSPALSHLNLGIVAHVDAGKTSLTERLLFQAGAIDAVGSVDSGTTSTDSMDLERRRGITIRAAVTSFAVPADATDTSDPADSAALIVNLLDTPGHPDFIAEVERSLGVLDAAVLVLSAVEGVQPQTVVIWRALQRIGVPTVLFVNKIDRAGADVDRVLDQIRRRLTPRPVPLTTAADQGTRAARSVPLDLTDNAVVTAVAEADEAVLNRWAADRPALLHQVRRGLRTGVREARLTPVLCGSAITGAGAADLRRVITDLLAGAVADGLSGTPDPADTAKSAAAAPAAGTTAGPRFAGTVFAVDLDDRGRRAWIRIWSGALHVRDRMALPGHRPVPVTEVAVSEPGGLRIRRSAGAGQIAAVRGPAARIGDSIGISPRRTAHQFAAATLQSVVEPLDPHHRTAMFSALTELADSDPLIDLTLDADPVVGEAAASIRLHGEVQEEVIASLLAERYGVPVRFSATSVICLERVVGTGSAVDEIHQRGNPYLAGVGLRIESAPVGHGVSFSPGIQRGHLPFAFINATEEGVRTALRQGLNGWAVTDCHVIMTASQYWPRQSRPHQKFDKSISSIAADFRHLAPVVLMAALAEAGTVVCQPIERFDLEIPEVALPTLAALLGRLGAATTQTTVAGGYSRLGGYLPSTAIPDLAARLPDLTSGEGVLATRADHHDPVVNRSAPRRRRTGHDPLDRQGWFRAVPR